MKNFLTTIALFFLIGSLSAKKVKFAVDMTTFTISPNGIHVMGDFQVIAGFSADWDAGATTLTQEGSSNIYSIVVDLPAFQKYEFKFVDGDQSYEAEFVPDEARVGYGFNDNRWLYVDSLTNDTTFLGAVKFSGNSPAGKTLIRYKVDMSNAGTVSSNGVHVTTSYQPDPAKIRLYSFGSGVYEIINYVTTGNYSFKYYNGNTSGNAETVPGGCATSGMRTTGLPKDSILPVVCFEGCSACVVGVKENSLAEQIFRMSPNPAANLVTLHLKSGSVTSVVVFDNTGKQVIILRELPASGIIDVSGLGKGIYFVRAFGNNNISQTQKLIKE
ncbi:MAG: C-terminal target protein [Bacteroidetes bacterium]|jgi:hypothetical protein|nr:C-terminal target protein [Bacteroidota bacterium]